MNLSLIRKSFNKAAASYDSACHLQLQTGKYLIRLLKDLNLKQKTLLDAGCGTGIITKQLITELDVEKIYAIDIAEACIQQAKEKIINKNIIFELADFNNLPHIDTNFDIIYANLALHWSMDISKTLVHLKEKLSQNGLLAFTMPLIGTFHEIEEDFSVQNFMEKLIVENLITHNGFKIICSEAQQITFKFPHLIDALKSIKNVGASYVPQRNLHAFKHLRHTIKSQQVKNFELTYHIGYFICQ